MSANRFALGEIQMAIRILDPNEIIFDAKGKVVGTNGDDADLWYRGKALLHAMSVWYLEKRLVEADVGPKEMLELTETLLDFTYHLDNFESAMDHLNIWCNVMKEALPHVVREVN